MHSSIGLKFDGFKDYNASTNCFNETSKFLATLALKRFVKYLIVIMQCQQRISWCSLLKFSVFLHSTSFVKLQMEFFWIANSSLPFAQKLERMFFKYAWILLQVIGIRLEAAIIFIFGRQINFNCVPLGRQTSMSLGLRLESLTVWPLFTRHTFLDESVFFYLIWATGSFPNWWGGN